MSAADVTLKVDPGTGPQTPNAFDYSKLSAPRAWRGVIKDALSRRLRPPQLEILVKHLQERKRPSSAGLARILISFRKLSGAGTDDPLLFRYIEVFLNNGCIEPGDLLRALLQHSTFAQADATRRETGTQFGFPSCEERIFTILTRQYMTELPDATWKVLNLIHAVSEWLHVVNEIETAKQLQNAGLHAVDAFTFATYEALAQLAIAVFRNPLLQSLLAQRWWRASRPRIVACMESFDANVLQMMQSQYVGLLTELTGRPPFLEIDKHGKPVFSDRQVMSMIPELSVAYSRVGLFVWLDSALAARPCTDDMAMLGYLQARFPGDAQSAIVSVLTASFDVLTCAMLRKEPRQYVKLIRSFICNKLPILLVVLSGSLAPPMTIEACIQMPFMAGGSISMDPLPPLSSGATDINEILKLTRLEMLQACHLHDMMSEGGIATVLNGPIALPRVTKFVKETLIAQANNNISRLEAIIDDLDGMQGNAAAIAGCVITMIGNLCIAEDTMSLKTVCNELVRRPSSLDILMQYTQPHVLLLPLCTLLNDWRHDQDQTELTPSYEEFASILLFTIAVIHHFDLQTFELGVLPDSFICRLMDELSSSKPPSELTEDQKSQLGKWIEGLFSVDENGETSGIGDDVMRQCPPQSFYLLVPTLFEQSVLACRARALNMKALQGGLELLLEPFLLPSLIMGLNWLAKHSWEDHNDASVLLQIMEKLLKHASTSQETLGMHRAIIAIVAAPLFESLQMYLRSRPADKKAMELSIFMLKNYIRMQPLQRTLHCNKGQLEVLVKQGGKIEQHVADSVRSLINWTVSTSGPPNPPPPFSYKTFTMAAHVLDGGALLDSVLGELQQVPIAQLPLALDVCTAIACAPPSITNGSHHTTSLTAVTAKLRESIQVRAANPQALLDRPAAEAEILVHLSRRVEAQLAVAHMGAIPLPMEIHGQAADQMMQELGIELPDATTAADGTDMVSAMVVDDMGALDSTLGVTDASAQQLSNLVAVQPDEMQLADTQIFGDMGLDMSQPVQDNLTNPEDDIFADLMGVGDLGDLGDDFNFE